jgi:phosphoglycolate/pyridoxal phosphate phosphatase family enzyme
MTTFSLRDKEIILLDCDGVIWRGEQPIKGARESLDWLQNVGFRLGFVTNNSSLSRLGFKQKFQQLGFNPEDYTIINSAYGAALYLHQNNYRRVFIIGEKGLREELELLGISVFEKYEPDLQAVCIGWDRFLSWKKLADAMRVILYDDGAFIGTNPDNSYPVEEGRLAPGAGAGIAALATACDRKPDIILGKPNPYLLELALSDMNSTNPSKAVYVGDRLSTDIKAGINAGIETILVKTGVYEENIDKRIIPTYEIDSIAQIPELLRKS